MQVWLVDMAFYQLDNSFQSLIGASLGTRQRRSSEEMDVHLYGEGMPLLRRTETRPRTLLVRDIPYFDKVKNIMHAWVTKKGYAGSGGKCYTENG